MDCGGPATVMKSGRYRNRCQPCRFKNERTTTCSRCGNARDGSHAAYCRECYKAYSREWTRKNPEKAALKDRRARLKKAYGLTEEDWRQMLADQGHACAICGTGDPGGRGFTETFGFHVDHCHTTGVVRGLLCHRCNLAIGHAEDDPQRLRRMADYLEMERPPRACV